MSEQQRRAAQVASGLVELKVAPRTPPVPEEHLGDRLAAFVDGELDHGARERVQSHLAGCAQCLAEVELQRRLKSRLREVPSPAPSDVFLSRLMGLSAQEEQPTDRQDPPAGAPLGDVSNVRPLFGGGGLGMGSFGRGSSLFGSGALGAEHPVPGIDPRAALVAAAAPAAAPRRRFAFVAAGAVSVAAVALSSALTGVSASESPSAPTTTTPVAGSGAYTDTPATSRVAFQVQNADDLSALRRSTPSVSPTTLR